MPDIRSETKKRQDEARETGRAAGRSLADSPQGQRVREHLKKDMTEDEKTEFEKGYAEGRDE